MTFRAAILFHEPGLADATLYCEAPNETVLLKRVKRLIKTCGLKPRVMNNYHQNQPFVVMMCRGELGVDGDLTRRIQFGVYDWMEK